ncbi:MAG: SDR family oxidoreductase [Sarcina sp.]
MNMENNNILITGGSRGIGLGLVEKLIDKNEILVVSRNEKNLEELKKKYPKLKIYPCDMGSMSSIDSLVEYIKANFKDINVVVNNAGIQKTINLMDEDITLEEIRINLEGPMYLNSKLINYIKYKNNPYIINVSSQLAMLTMAKYPLYCATKAALHSYTKSLRYQLKDSGINVVEILPPAVDTELNLEERQKNNFKVDLPVEKYVDDVLMKLSKGNLEIFFEENEEKMKGSNEYELDKISSFMNK